MTADGRWSRAYISDGPPGHREWLFFVTYHRCINGRTRQLSISPKLLRKVLRDP